MVLSDMFLIYIFIYYGTGFRRKSTKEFYVLTAKSEDIETKIPLLVKSETESDASYLFLSKIELLWDSLVK